MNSRVGNIIIIILKMTVVFCNNDKYLLTLHTYRKPCTYILLTFSLLVIDKLIIL